MSLFANTEANQAKKPLAWRLAPKSLDEYCGQKHLLEKGKPLRQLIEADAICSLVLWGPPGCGKTALSRLIAKHSEAHFMPLNATMAAIADIKEALKQAKDQQDFYGRKSILFIDEIHRFSKTQQDALLPSVEKGLITLIGATTENPFFSIIPALTSRCQVFELYGHTTEDLKKLLQKAIETVKQTKPFELPEDCQSLLIHYAKGDARKLITLVETLSRSNRPITQKLIDELTQSKGIAGNLDSHYDLISAYIKSMRGSDANAAIYWLARLLKSGEDPRFITRRMVIFASEDIGIADSKALLLASSAQRAAETIGMPEVQINLSHVTTYLAKAKKSNKTYAAINKANQWIDSGKVYPVPNHLKDAHYKQAKRLGHGEGYIYTHSNPNANQQFLPEDVNFLED